jgi:hypothetical protein
LSRRLGDDPLTRARAERAKAAEGSASAALESGGQQRTAQVGVHSTRASYNDVFFQRKEVAAGLQVANAQPPEAPEISEISEIPEIREVAAVSSQPPLDPTPALGPEPSVAQAHQVSTIEEAVARLNSQAAPAFAASRSPQANEEPVSRSTASQAPPSQGDEPKPEPQKGGFLKRLFGKFK